MSIVAGLTILALAGLVIVGFLTRSHKYVTSATRHDLANWNRLVKAVQAGSVAEIHALGLLNDLLRIQDALGDTLLHYAYHSGRSTEIIELLIAFGADESCRNSSGLVPDQMTEVAAMEALLIDGAANLSIHGNWIDKGRGLSSFDRLQEANDDIYLHALTIATARHPLRRALLTLGIKLGKDVALEMMIAALYSSNSKGLAEMYLNSGRDYLARGAHRWANLRGYIVQLHPGREQPKWGSF